MIHRDLKPENWLFVRREEDTIKLCDFGSAVQLSATRSRTRQLGGTVVYQAPEIHLGLGGGAAADDWGLGAVLLEWGASHDWICFPKEHVALSKTKYWSSSLSSLSNQGHVYLVMDLSDYSEF